MNYNCADCGILKTKDNCRNNRHGNLLNICKNCESKKHRIYMRNRKTKYIQYKGGKCENCGYDKCESALEFHHNNPEEKEFTLSKYKIGNSIKDSDSIIKKELDKCSLLCGNCHREEHAKKQGWLMITTNQPLT